jgi:hypothetical protein
MATEEEVIDRGDFFEESNEDETEEMEGEEDEGSQESDSDDDDDDSEDDEDADETGGDESDEEEEVAPPKKEPRIPKSRFDEINNRMKDANERNLWLEEQLEKLINQQSQQQKTAPREPEAPSYDYDTAEEEYITLIINGDIAKATKLRNDINAHRQSDLAILISGIENKASDNAKSQSGLLLEKERFESSIVNMEKTYPFLNHKDKAYNEEAVETVNTLLAGYLAAGKGKVESLQLAIKKVLPLYEKKVTTKTTLGDQRKTEAGKKAAAASKQQPTKQKTTTRTSDMGKANINTMSDRDFSKLTAKEKSILRGD